MNIIILGDRYQKRMKSKGCVGLIKYKNNNILYHQYKICKKIFPNSKIIYIYGFDNKKFVSHIADNSSFYSDVIFVENKNYEDSNSGYSLNIVKDYLNDETLILPGDYIFSTPIFNNFKNTTLSQVFVSKKEKHSIGCIINNGAITNISYDLDNYVSGIYFISKSQIDIFRKLAANQNYNNYFLFELFNKMIDLNQPISPCYI